MKPSWLLNRTSPAICRRVARWLESMSVQLGYGLISHTHTYIYIYIHTYIYMYKYIVIYCNLISICLILYQYISIYKYVFVSVISYIINLGRVWTWIWGQELWCWTTNGSCHWVPWGDSWGRGLVRHTVVVSGGRTCLPSTHEDESPALFLSFLSITLMK